MERRSFVEDGVLREIPLNSVLSTRLSQDSGLRSCRCEFFFDVVSHVSSLLTSKSRLMKFNKSECF